MIVEEEEAGRAAPSRNAYGESSTETEDEDEVMYGMAPATRAPRQDTKNSSDTEPEMSPIDKVDYDEEKELSEFISQYGLLNDSSSDLSHHEDEEKKTPKRGRGRKKSTDTSVSTKTPEKRRGRPPKKKAAARAGRKAATKTYNTRSSSPPHKPEHQEHLKEESEEEDEHEEEVDPDEDYGHEKRRMRRKSKKQDEDTEEQKPVQSPPPPMEHQESPLDQAQEPFPQLQIQLHSNVPSELPPQIAPEVISYLQQVRQEAQEASQQLPQAAPEALQTLQEAPEAPSQIIQTPPLAQAQPIIKQEQENEQEQISSPPLQMTPAQIQVDPQARGRTAYHSTRNASSQRRQPGIQRYMQPVPQKSTQLPSHTPKVKSQIHPFSAQQKLSKTGRTSSQSPQMQSLSLQTKSAQQKQPLQPLQPLMLQPRNNNQQQQQPQPPQPQPSQVPINTNTFVPQQVPLNMGILQSPPQLPSQPVSLQLYPQQSLVLQSPPQQFQPPPQPPQPLRQLQLQPENTNLLQRLQQLSVQATQKQDPKMQPEQSNLSQKLQELSSRVPKEQGSKPHQLKLPQLDNSKIAQKLQPSSSKSLKTPKAEASREQTSISTAKAQQEGLELLSRQQEQGQVSRTQATQQNTRKSQSPDKQDKYQRELHKELRKQEKLMASQASSSSADSAALSDLPGDGLIQETPSLNDRSAAPKDNATPVAMQESVLVENFPYSGPIPDYNNIEKFISRRVCVDSKNPEKKPYHEYLVKFANFSYRQCKWIAKSFFESKQGSKVHSQFRSFETKWERNLEKGVSTENIIDICSKHDDYDESITEFLTPEGILYCVDNPRKVFKNESLPDEKIYLTKWWGVKVGDSTWETKESLCNNKLIRTFDNIRKYSDRKKYVWKKEESFFRRMKKYQKLGVAWAYKNYAENNRNVIIGDDFGLGKRVQSLFTLAEIAKSELSKKSGQRPIFLVITQIDDLRSWQEDIQFYTSFKSVLYSGSYDERSIIEDLLFFKNNPDPKKPKIFNFDILLTSYESCIAEEILENEIFTWKYVIFDEGYRLHGTKYNKYFTKVRPANFMVLTSTPLIEESEPKVDPSTLEEGVENVIDSDSISLLTNTPAEKSAFQDLWTLLCFVDPNLDKDFDAFANMTADKKRALIKQYYIRRRNVYKQPSVEAPGMITLGYPTKKEQISVHHKAVLPEITPLQKIFLKRTYMKNMQYLKRRKEPLSSLMLVVEDIEKCLTHPKLKQNSENIEYFDIGDGDGSSAPGDNASEAGSEKKTTPKKLGTKSPGRNGPSEDTERAERERVLERQARNKEDNKLAKALLEKSRTDCAMSGKILFLKHLLPKLLEKGHRVVFFSTCLEALEVLHEELITNTLGCRWPHSSKVVSEVLDGNTIEREIVSASHNESYAMAASMNLGLFWISGLLNLFDDIIFLDIETVENQPLENALDNLIQMVPPVGHTAEEPPSKNVYYLLARNSFESVYFRERCFTNSCYSYPPSQKKWIDMLVRSGTASFFEAEPAGAQVLAEFKGVKGVTIDDPKFWVNVFKGSDAESFSEAVEAAEKADLNKVVDFDLVKRISDSTKKISHRSGKNESRRAQDGVPLSTNASFDAETPRKDATERGNEKAASSKAGTVLVPVKMEIDDDDGNNANNNVDKVVQTRSIVSANNSELPPPEKRMKAMQSGSASMPAKADTNVISTVVISDAPPKLDESNWIIGEMESIIKNLGSFGWGTWAIIQSAKLPSRSVSSIERMSYMILSEMLNEVDLGIALVFVLKILGFRVVMPTSSFLGRPFRPERLFRPDSLDSGGTMIGMAYGSDNAAVDGRSTGDFFEDDPVFKTAQFAEIKKNAMVILKDIALATELRHLARAVRSGYNLRLPKYGRMPPLWGPGDDVQLLHGIYAWGVDQYGLDKIYRDESLTFSKALSGPRRMGRGYALPPSYATVMLHIRLLLNANRAWVLPIVSAIDHAAAVALLIKRPAELDQITKVTWTQVPCGCPPWWRPADDAGIVYRLAKIKGMTTKFLHAAPACMKSGEWYDENDELEEVFWTKVTSSHIDAMPQAKFTNLMSQHAARAGEKSVSAKAVLREAGFPTLRVALDRFFWIYSVFEEMNFIDYIFPLSTPVVITSNPSPKIVVQQLEQKKQAPSRQSARSGSRAISTPTTLAKALSKQQQTAIATTLSIPSFSTPLKVQQATIPLLKAQSTTITAPMKIQQIAPAALKAQQAGIPTTMPTVGLKAPLPPIAPIAQPPKALQPVPAQQQSNEDAAAVPMCSDVNLSLLSASRDGGDAGAAVADLSLLKYSSQTSSLVLPIAVEWGLEVEDLGTIDPAFSNEACVYPVNYRATRVINNPYEGKNGLIKCECLITKALECGGFPVFKIIAGEKKEWFVGATPSEACVNFFVHCGYSAEDIPRNCGETFFGLNNPLVVHVVQSSSRIALCPSYKRKPIKTIESIVVI